MIPEERLDEDAPEQKEYLHSLWEYITQWDEDTIGICGLNQRWREK